MSARQSKDTPKAAAAAEATDDGKAYHDDEGAPDGFMEFLHTATVAEKVSFCENVLGDILEMMMTMKKNVLALKEEDIDEAVRALSLLCTVSQTIEQ